MKILLTKKYLPVKLKVIKVRKKYRNEKEKSNNYNNLFF